MDAPKCKICGQRHYGPCVAAARHEPVQAPPLHEEMIARTPASPTRKQPFDRTAYQRRYMQEYRARKRAAKENADGNPE